MNSRQFKTSSYFVIRLTILAVLVVALFVNKKAKAQLENIISISSANSETKNYAGINSLMTAISENDVDGVKFFVKANPKLINEENVGGATPLHIAARIGNLEIVKTLLENDANINATDNEKWTALMRASMAANPLIVEALLEKNANILLVNNAGEGAIVHSSMSDCNHCLVLLSNKAKADPANFNANNKQLISDQLTKAYTISQSKQNRDAQAILSEFLTFIGSIKSQETNKNDQEKSIKIIDPSPQNSEEVETVIIQEISLNPIKNKQNKTPSKFKFVKGQEGKVEPVKNAKKFKLKKPQVKDQVMPAKSPKIQEQTQDNNTTTAPEINTLKTVTEPVKNEAIPAAQPTENTKYKFVKGAEPVVKNNEVKTVKKTKKKIVKTSQAKEEDLAPKTLATIKVEESKPEVKTVSPAPLEKVDIMDEKSDANTTSIAESSNPTAPTQTSTNPVNENLPGATPKVTYKFGGKAE